MKLRSIFIFLMSMFQLVADLPTTAKEMKILVLVVASDDAPVYLELQNKWRSYMHLDPEHVEAYFVKANPKLDSLCEIKEDVIWVRTETSVNPGMINKTILAMEHMCPRLKEFDFVVRTNLSSFYVFPRLFKFLQTLPKTGCYCAVNAVHDGILFGSGCGLIFSPDLVELMAKEKEWFLDRSFSFEDVVIGSFFQNEKIPIRSASRIDLLAPDVWERAKDSFPQDAFHFRIKNSDPGVRIREDIYIYSGLLKMFYNIP